MSVNIDWLVPQTCVYDSTVADKVRKRGGEMWWYVSLQPNYPYANFLVENPLIECRNLWWQSFQKGVDGVLYWGLSVWIREHNNTPIPTSAGPRIDWSLTTGVGYANLNGDGVLLYPGTDGPIGSIRLESICDGLEDIELLKQFQDVFGRQATATITNRVSKSLTDYSRNPEDLFSVRRRLLKALAKSAAENPGPIVSGTAPMSCCSAVVADFASNCPK